jgi:serpin B
MSHAKDGLAALAVMVLALVAAAPVSGAPAASAVKFSAAATSLGETELSSLTAAKPGSTVLTSPLSVEAALAMVGQGARGATLAGMRSALGLAAQGLTMPEAASGYAALRQALAPSSGVTLALANGAWVDRRINLNPAFAATEQGPFAARIAAADFADPASAAQINAFVANATRGQITHIVDGLAPDMRLVLVNALYFKGVWQTRFDPAETKDDPFTSGDGRTAPTPTMHRRGLFAYYETDAFQAVALPYKDPRFELVLLLPKRPGEAPPAGWTSSLAGANFDLKDGYVALPRLDIQWRADLAPSLRSTGLAVALEPEADFGGLADRPVFVSQVVHETRLIVDEEGTVGAAATAVVMPAGACFGCQEPQPFSFIADRPFWLLLRETSTGAPVFLGYVAAPRG